MTSTTPDDTTTEDTHPRFCRGLHGHGGVLDAINPGGGGRHHQSFIFSGPRGIGKASAAWTLATRLLSLRPSEENLLGTEEAGLAPGAGAEHLSGDIDPAERALVEAGSHPDMLSIEPAEDRASKTISVDQIRKITPFLSHHPARGGWRVVIVDALDAVNYNGANAMLKILEEPPNQSVIILIHHGTRPVLATIRSRCQVVRLAPLDFDTSRGVITRLFPDAVGEWIDTAAVLADGAPGRAVLLAESEAVDLYARTCTALAESGSSLKTLDDLARAWGPGGGQNLPRRQAASLVFDRLLTLAARRSIGASGGTSGGASGEGGSYPNHPSTATPASTPNHAPASSMDMEEKAVAAILNRMTSDELAESHQDLTRRLAEAETLNLDAAIPIYALLVRLAGGKM